MNPKRNGSRGNQDVSWPLSKLCDDERHYYAINTLRVCVFFFLVGQVRFVLSCVLVLHGLWKCWSRCNFRPRHAKTFWSNVFLFWYRLPFCHSHCVRGDCDYEGEILKQYSASHFLWCMSKKSNTKLIRALSWEVPGELRSRQDSGCM